MLIVLGLVAAGTFVGWVVGHYAGRHTSTVTVSGSSTSPAPTRSSTATTAKGGAAVGGGNPKAGRQLFAANCGGCHTLKVAGTSGTIGPNLDQVKLPLSLVLDRVTNGRGAMPSFRQQLSEQQIEDVATFVVASTSGR